jgi:hypothetical protein
VRVAGDLRFYRHIDPVTGRGAAAIHAGRTDVPLDFRHFTLDILLRPGRYVVKGYWSDQERLVVTEAHPGGGRTAALP